MGRISRLLLLTIVTTAMPPAGCGTRDASRDSPNAVSHDSSRAAANAPAGAVERVPDLALPPAPGDSFAAPPLTTMRIAPAAGANAVPPPEAAPGEPPAATGAIDRLPVDDALRAPVPRTSARWPAGVRASGWIELDVRVDERGEVTDARFAAGSGDSALVHAAIRAALAMRYLPARRAGVPVAVWCRQRFERGR